MNRVPVSRYGWIVALLAVMLASASVAAAAQSSKSPGFDAKDIQRFVQDVVRGKQAYANQDYENAVAALVAALASSEKFPPATQADFKGERVEGYRYLAYSYVALEQFDNAVGAFRKLLALDPQFDPGEVSPKIRKVFDAARGGPAVPGAAAGIEHHPVPSIQAGQPLTIRANVRLGADLAKVKVFLKYRIRPTGSYTKTAMLDVGEAVFVGVIPSKVTQKATIIQYYLTVEGAGAQPVEMGSEDKPIEVHITPAPFSKTEEPAIPRSRGDSEF